MDELRRKGLDPEILLGMEFPGDITLGEARKAIKSRDFWKALIKDAREPERVDILFGWRYPDGSESWVSDATEIGQWRGKDGVDPFISITDGSGGTKVRQPEPELVG